MIDAETLIRWPDPETGPVEVRLRWRDIEGRFEVVSTDICHLTEEPLTAVLMRSLPWGRIAEAARPGPFESRIITVDSDGSPLVYSKRKGFGRRRTGRPRKYGPEHFAEVSRVYREAYARNRTPTRAVASHFGATESAAAKWVARCRDMGLLPKTTRGRARAVATKKGKTTKTKTKTTTRNTTRSSKTKTTTTTKRRS